MSLNSPDYAETDETPDETLEIGWEELTNNPLGSERIYLGNDPKKPTNIQETGLWGYIKKGADESWAWYIISHAGENPEVVRSRSQTGWQKKEARKDLTESFTKTGNQRFTLPTLQDEQ